MRYLLPVLMMIWCSSAAGAVTATLDRTVVAEGESVSLSIEVDGQAQGVDPDLSPLEALFEVISSRRSSQINMINGRVDSRTVWEVMLIPRNSGRLIVPSLTIGNETTPALTLTVNKGGATAQAPARELFVETLVEPKQPYVQSQVIYSVRIWIAANLSEANLSEPEVEGAIVERLGDDRRFSSRRSGREYQVIERRYALFPQRSGELVIKSPVLEAQISQGRGRDLFSSVFSRTRAMRIRGDEQRLDVRPAAIAGDWLPAISVELNEEWSQDPLTLKVGEPVTRTVVMRGTGVTSANLPPLEGALQDGLNLYPDQPAYETLHAAEGVVGVRTERLAVVPAQAGTFELPAIEVRWWDVERDRQAIATLPPRRLVVTGAAPTLPVTPPITTVPSLPAPGPLMTDAGSGAASQAEQPATAAGWPVTVALLAAGWLITLFLWWRQQRRSMCEKTATAAQKSARERPRKALAAVKRAATGDDPQATRVALLEWAASQWPDDPPLHLLAIIARLRLEGVADEQIDSLHQLLSNLDRSLYHAPVADWQGAPLWQALATALTSRRQRGGDDSNPLPPLYPVS